MACIHLQQLYKLCQEQDLRLSSSDLIHIVCTQCDEQEVCPSALTRDHDAEYPATDSAHHQARPSAS
jgi:hypothetical protein